MNFGKLCAQWGDARRRQIKYMWNEKYYHDVHIRWAKWKDDGLDWFSQSRERETPAVVEE